MMSIEEVVAESSKDGRVCPQPRQWNKLWKLLPNRRRAKHGGWEPPLPLILAMWTEATDEEKRERFETHIRWAHEHDALDRIAKYLDRLDSTDWFRENEI